MRPRQSSWKWLLAVLFVVAAAGLGFLLLRAAWHPSDLRGRVTAALSAWTGGDVTLKEPLRVRYFPPSLEGGFALSGATKLPAIQSVTAPSFRLTLSLPDLMVGSITFNALRLGKPTLTLKAGHGEGLEGPGLVRLTDFLADAPLQTVRIHGGKVKPPRGAPVIRALDVRLNTRGQRGAVDAFGSFMFKGEPVTFSFDRGKRVDTSEGSHAPVALKVTSEPLTARFSGMMQIGDTPGGEGELEAKIPDIRRFLSWTGVGLPDGDSLKNARASGQIHWTGSTLTFDDGTFDFDGNEAVGLLAITSGDRPRIDGTLAFEQLTLDPYLPDAETDRKAKAPFDWVLLKHLDADLRISAAELSARGFQLGQGGFTINAKNGKISNEIGALEFCGGQAEGRLDLDLSAPRTEAALTGSVDDVVLAKCLQALGLNVPVTGAATFRADVSTGGTSHDELIRGLAGTISVAAKDGTLPLDFLALMTKPEAETSGWNDKAGTAFSALKADCSLSAGHLWCQSFRMDTDKAAISGAGGLDIAQQTLDWDFRMHDPVEATDSPEPVSNSGPSITMNGTLSVPSLARIGQPEPQLGASTQATPKKALRRANSP